MDPQELLKITGAFLDRDSDRHLLLFESESKTFFHHRPVDDANQTAYLIARFINAMATWMASGAYGEEFKCDSVHEAVDAILGTIKDYNRKIDGQDVHAFKDPE